jgi:hypothetical protein
MNGPHDITMQTDAEGRLWILADGVPIARRGRPGTPQAMTWIVLDPAWTIYDSDYPHQIVLEFHGRLH